MREEYETRREESEASPEEDVSPLSEEELALAHEGEQVIADSVADVRAPQSVHEAIERKFAKERAGSKGP